MAFGNSLGCFISAIVFFPFFVDLVSVSLPVLVVTLNRRARDFVDPRLLNLHLRLAKINVEALAHAI